MINKRLEIDKLKSFQIKKKTVYNYDSDTRQGIVSYVELRDWPCAQIPITSLTRHVHKPLSPVSSSLQLKSTIEGAPYFSEKSGAFNVVNLTTYLDDAVEITKLIQTGV